MMRISAFIFLACSCFIVSIAEGQEPIPVLLWSPEKHMSEHEAGGSNIFESDEFHKSVLKPLVSDDTSAAVVFLQDKLHTNDFTHFADVYSLDSEGGAFANLKSLMEDNFSLEVPQVFNPVKSIEKLKAQFKGAVHTVSSAEQVEALNLQPGAASFLLIVHLPATEGTVDREAALQKSDELMGRVCKHLKERSINYLAAFTGQTPSQVMAEEGETHSGRHLLEDTPEVNANGTFMNISGVSYLFMRDVFICVKNSSADCITNFTLIPVEHSADSSEIGNKTATIDLVFNKVKPGNTSGDEFDIKISTLVFDQGDRWVIDSIRLFITPQDQKKNASDIQNATLSPGEMDWKVPILYSFHCTEMRMNLDHLIEGFANFKGTYVVINGFQFQPFRIQQNRFFNAVDCVGFFNTAILMGLFPVVLLLIILMYGTLMLLDLSIMDRYDDPKGKTITVHASSE